MLGYPLDLIIGLAQKNFTIKFQNCFPNRRNFCKFSGRKRFFPHVLVSSAFETQSQYTLEVAPAFVHWQPKMAEFRVAFFRVKTSYYNHFFETIVFPLNILKSNFSETSIIFHSILSQYSRIGRFI